MNSVSRRYISREPTRFGNPVPLEVEGSTISTDGQPGSLATRSTRRQPDLRRFRRPPIPFRILDLWDTDVIPRGDPTGLGLSSQGRFQGSWVLLPLFEPGVSVVGGICAPVAAAKRREVHAGTGKRVSLRRVPLPGGGDDASSGGLAILRHVVDRRQRRAPQWRNIPRDLTALPA